MKKLITAFVWLLAVPGVASAQESKYPTWGIAYAYFGRSNRNMGQTTGFGAEGSVFRNLGLDLDLGAAGLGESSNGNRNTIGVGSADASYHFFRKSVQERVVPFVTGGYTMFFGQDVFLRPGIRYNANLQHGYNLGAGVDLFATKHVGARFEVRYYGHGGRILWASYPNLPQLSFTAVRFAFTFR